MKNGIPKILLIDDEPEFLAASQKLLQRFKYDCVATEDADLGLRMLSDIDFDLVISDYLMPSMDGVQLLKAAHQLQPNLPVIILTAFGSIDRAVTCMQAGAFDFIEKPFESDHFKIVIEKALKYTNLVNERNHLLQQLESRYQFENIIGKSDAMLRIFDMVNSVAESDANILITGESGTGKELIARSIHTRSKRKTGPFVPVNCGAFPDNLFESEIFGYEKGAFTGAAQRKIGLLEYANTGSFFLDEVCELPLGIQSKLLRVLQDRELRRLGGHDLIRVDVRIISATNRNPQAFVTDGYLREDLYYRLNVINIHIPPLRERQVDIRLLANHFLTLGLSKTGKEIEDFSPDVLQAFETYNWPGNVRELENVVERAIALTKSQRIEITDLPPNFQQTDSREPAFEELSLQQAKLKAVEKVEKDYLLYLLRKHTGNVTRLAEEAGMTRRNLYRLLDKYKIKPDHWR
ncbi:MAG: sigma-54 dependent transcriptional regulator [Candidatus Marinimicrobia bacterium]|nr:sigma-54 dependent transcriptional regulator [Candidatus Neomarinimicrobiota bacterium]MCF7840171.1 sigma-54 dependent transcriptional regulator [Candidatus Neomarinimicrobiota bacterium]MCF7902636.1 sigma-54 dependent transcriptional regulator [Candidatus Neomarinimicrobiota bacterium]